VRRGPWVVAAALGLGALAAVGVGRLQVESHILRFFAPEHPLVRATAEVEAQLMGLTPLEVWVEGPTARVVSAEAIAALRRFTATVTAEPDVLGVISPLDLDPRLAALSPALAARALRAALARGELAADATSHVRVHGERIAVRITLACATTASERSLRLSGRVREALAAGFPPDLDVRLTGAIPILVRIQALLLRTQVRSFAGALGVVTLLLVLALRSPALAALSLVPNVLPVLFTLGGMGWCGLPLDVATVTVAGIALGLVVDDTIHLLHRYHLARGAGAAAPAAVAAALRGVGRPVVVTSLALGLGFLAFGAAPFRPTRDFGLLTAATAATALLMDLAVLPALILLPVLRGGRTS